MCIPPMYLHTSTLVTTASILIYCIVPLYSAITCFAVCVCMYMCAGGHLEWLCFGLFVSLGAAFG